MVENCPWCLWTSLNWKDYAHWGEWAWVGREDYSQKEIEHGTERSSGAAGVRAGGVGGAARTAPGAARSFADSRSDPART